MQYRVLACQETCLGLGRFGRLAHTQRQRDGTWPIAIADVGVGFLVKVSTGERWLDLLRNTMKTISAPLITYCGAEAAAVNWKSGRKHCECKSVG